MKQKKYFSRTLLALLVLVVLINPLFSQQYTIDEEDRHLWKSVSDSLQQSRLQLLPYQRKISDNLRVLQKEIQDASKQQLNVSEKLKESLQRSAILYNKKKEMLLDIIVRDYSALLLSQLDNLGIDYHIPEHSYGIKRIIGYVDVSSIETIAKNDDVLAVVPYINPETNVGENETEGLERLRIREVFERYLAEGYRGRGVKVGVISDGVSNISYAQSIGELPSDVNVIGVGHGNEGIAMLEIVHDIARDADLYFDAPYAPSFRTMIAAIKELVDAGVEIIVDDLFYLTTPWMDDQMDISAAIKDAVQNNVLYISSAGNYAKRHYEADYEDFDNDGYHDFYGSNKLDLPSMMVGTEIKIVLQWNEKFNKSDANYDVYLYENDIGETDDLLLAKRTEVNFWPFEMIEYKLGNEDGAIDLFLEPYLILSRLSSGNGITPEHFKIIIIEPDKKMSNGHTNYGSISGHQISKYCMSVAAIAQDEPNIDEVEEFSSQGNSRIYNFDGNGDPIGFIEREKPEITAVDKVDVSGTGGFQDPFSGTSAAAPHVAGIAALLKSASPNLTNDQIRTILENTAEEVGTYTYGDSGKSVETGHGRIDALNAIRIGRKENQTYLWTEKFLNCYTHEGVKFGGRNPGKPLNDVISNWNGYEYQKFENGAIVYKLNNADAYWLGEGIFLKWEETGVMSMLGEPLSNEFSDATNFNYRTVNFEHGKIYWDGTIAHVEITDIGEYVISLRATPASLIANGTSTASISAQITDQTGTPISTATNEITFSIISGASSGQLIGQNPVAAINGQATINLRSTTVAGIVTIEATSPGLVSGRVSVVVYNGASPTEIGGNITENTTLSLAQSPYAVTSSLNI